MGLNTPLYDLRQFVNVYEPGEDTFLFLDALEFDMNAIIEVEPDFIAEIGSGSGVIITSLASVLHKNAVCFGTDINYEACLATTLTATLNNARVDSCCMNLLRGFRQGIFDLVFFNPPYVITEPAEIEGTGLTRAWAGGRDGRQIIDKFLSDLPSLLSPKGICYLLVIKENKPEEIKEILRDYGFSSIILKERRILGEHLFVMKIQKYCNN